MGERIGMDIANIIWDRVVNIIENSGDYQGCKEEFLHILAMEVPFTSEEYINQPREVLTENAFQAAIGNFNRRTERIQTVANPIIKQVYENQGQMYERIMVPLTDGRRMFNIPCNLKEAYDTESKSVVKEFEKSILLHIIDDSWKENLRQLDELKHSVQNASYEQKDPLLIFKLESAKVWDDMINEMYNTQRQQYTESKQQIGEEQLVDRNQQAAAQHDTRAQQPRTPITKDKLPGRNDPCPCGSGKKFKNCHGKGIV